MLPERDGHARFMEKSKNGMIAFEVEELTPPQRIVTRIDGKNLPFGGRWIFEISPMAEGCRLNITERGEVYNPVFRFVSRFILGYTGTLDRYLTSVAKKFVESTVPVEGRCLRSVIQMRPAFYAMLRQSSEHLESCDC
jgi:hypothetical protein